MSIKVSEHHLDSTSVILWSFQENWQWQDFLTALDTTEEQLSDKPLCIVLDIRHDLPEKKLATKNIRHAINKLGGCEIIFVLEGAELSSNIVLNSLKDEFPDLKDKITILHTLNDAYQKVDPNYSGSDKDDLPSVLTPPCPTDS